jgi:hypothetical protein
MNRALITGLQEKTSSFIHNIPRLAVKRPTSVLCIKSVFLFGLDDDENETLTKRKSLPDIDDSCR